MRFAVSHTLLKARFFWTTFLQAVWIHLYHIVVTGPKATEIDRITQNKGHCVVQGHSRSPILVPIESPNATSYY